MAEVKIPKGYARTGPGLGRSVESFTDALQTLAFCGPCGCDSQLGYWTQIDALDGTLKVIYINNETLVIDDYDTGIAALKVLCAART